MNNRLLIKQYLDTGLQVSEKQLISLTDSQKKTYFRKRIINFKITFENLDDYEVNLMDKFNLEFYSNSKLNLRKRLTNKELDSIELNLEQVYFQYMLEKEISLNDYQFEKMPDFMKSKFLSDIPNAKSFTEKQFKLLNLKNKEIIIGNKIFYDDILELFELPFATESEKEINFKNNLNANVEFSDSYYSTLTSTQKKKYFQYIASEIKSSIQRKEFYKF